jgi:phage terminase Nu1 subunit (DNA packaging protein)
LRDILAPLGLPSTIEAMFTELEGFRIDLSSTQLREQMKTAAAPELVKRPEK